MELLAARFRTREAPAASAKLLADVVLSIASAYGGAAAALAGDIGAVDALVDMAEGGWEGAAVPLLSAALHAEGADAAAVDAVAARYVALLQRSATPERGLAVTMELLRGLQVRGARVPHLSCTS